MRMNAWQLQVADRRAMQFDQKANAIWKGLTQPKGVKRMDVVP
jgi:hypothetical protein